MTASSDDTYILVNPGWYVRIINVPVVVVVSNIIIVTRLSQTTSQGFSLSY